MKFYALLIATLLVGLESSGQQLADVTLRTQNGIEKELQIVHDTNNNYFLAGETYIPVGQGGTPGPTNIWLEKHDSFGQIMWTVGTDYTQTANSAELQSMAVDDTGNLYVTGVYAGGSVTFGNQTLNGYANFKVDFFIAKISPEGSVLWIIGPQADLNPAEHRIINSVSMANDGGIFISGGYYRTFNIGGMELEGEAVTTDDIRTPYSFIAKLNGNGEAQWVKKMTNLNSVGYNGGNGPADVRQAPSGNLFIRMWLDSAIVIDADTIVSAGSPANEDLGAIVKTDATGNVINFAITQSPYSTLRNLVLDKCGNPLILGTFMGSMQIGDKQITATSSRDVYVAKFDENLNCQWLKKHGSSEGDQAFGLYFNDKNEVFFTFEFWGELPNEPDYTPEGVDIDLVKLNADGEMIWNTHTAGTGLMDAMSLSVNSDNEVFTFGTMRGQKTFDDTTISTASGEPLGEPEAVLAKWNDQEYSGEPVDCGDLSGMEETAETTFTVYPNPTRKQLIIEGIANDTRGERIEIINLQGRLVQSEVIAGRRSAIDVSSLADGLYLIRFSDHPDASLKFIKR